MTPISLVPICDALVRVGPALLAGTTLLLSLGCLAIWRHRAPIHRQRLGELTIVGALVWLTLALVPLPRPLGLDPAALWKTPLKALPSHLPEIPNATADVSPSAPPIEHPSVDRAAGGPQQAGGLPVATVPFPIVHFKTVRLEGPSPTDLTNGHSASPKDSRPSVKSATATPSVLESLRTESPTQSLIQSPTGPLAEKVAALANQSALRVLAAAYLGGCGLCLVWLGLGTWLLRRVVRTARQPDEWLREAFERLSERGRMARTRVLVSTRYPRALSFGVWRPTIVLPAAECRVENRERMRHVLLHELAHVRQRDAWSNLLLNAAFVLLYFHPSFWWLRSRVRTSAELVADEWAAARSSRTDYARELVAFARSCRGRALRPAGAAGVLDSSTQFARRIEMLIRRDRPLATNSSATWRLAAAAGTVLCLLVLTAGLGEPARAQTGVIENRPAIAGIPLDRLVQVDVQLVDGDNAMANQGPTSVKVASPDFEAQLQELRRQRESLQSEVARLKAELAKRTWSPPTETEKRAIDAKIKRMQRAINEAALKEATTAQVKTIQDRILDGLTTNPKAGGKPVPPRAAFPQSSTPSKLPLRAFTLRFAQAAPVKQALVELFGDEMKELQLRILSDNRTNRILVFGGQDSELQVIADVIKLYDQPAPGPDLPVSDKPGYREEIPAWTEPLKGNKSRTLGKDKSDVQEPADPKAKQYFKRIDQGNQGSKALDFSNSQSLPSADTPADLVALADAYSDALGQVQEYQKARERTQNRVKREVIMEDELEGVTARLRQAERKVRMLRGIIDALRSAKEEQIKLGESRLATGLISDSDRYALIERKAKLAALDKILATGEADQTHIVK